MNPPRQNWIINPRNLAKKLRGTINNIQKGTFLNTEVHYFHDFYVLQKRHKKSDSYSCFFFFLRDGFEEPGKTKHKKSKDE